MNDEKLIELLRLVGRSADEAITILEGDTMTTGSGTTGEPTNGWITGEWHERQRMTGESWRWPDGSVDTYSEIVEYEGSGAFEGITLGLGYQDGPGKEGEVNGFVFGSGGGSKRPLTVFFPADDVDSSHELVSMIRGRDGSRSRRSLAGGVQRLRDGRPRPADRRQVERPGRRREGGRRSGNAQPHRDSGAAPRAPLMAVWTPREVFRLRPEWRSHIHRRGWPRPAA